MCKRMLAVEPAVPSRRLVRVHEPMRGAWFHPVRGQLAGVEVVENGKD
jgi:hypothetical protein